MLFLMLLQDLNMKYARRASQQMGFAASPFFIRRNVLVVSNSQLFRCQSIPPRKHIAMVTNHSDRPTGTTQSYATGKQRKEVRVFVDHPFVSGQEVSIPKTEVDHLRARRVRAGDTVVLFNSKGQTASAVLYENSVLVHTVTNEAAERGLMSAIIGLPKSPSRVDWVVEKLTELGVQSICFAITSRTVSVPPTDAKLRRWQRLSVAAAKQSLRTDIPTICVESFDEVLARVEQHRCPLLLSTGGMPFLSETISKAVRESGSVLLLVGPEGGFDEVEISRMIEGGAREVGLGAQRLRVETAAVVGAAIVYQLLV